jgi:acetyl-CoA acyltransferase
MTEVFICDAIRTPVGSYGGALAAVRADDLAAAPIAALLARHPHVDWPRGRRRRARLRQPGRRGQPQRGPHGALLAGTRPCGSRRDRQPALRLGPRRRGGRGPRHRAGEARLVLAGGVESMSRAPFVMGKAETAFSRTAQMHDTTIGWRFVNPRFHEACSAPTRCP